MNDFVLSLFPGIGLLDRAFEESGACIVRGPDVLWGGDIKGFHPPAGRFDGVIGGPPCKRFSRLAFMVELNHKRNPDKYHLAENLIPEFVRCINEARPAWFLMENVPDVPLDCWPNPLGYHVSSFVLNNRWVMDTTPQNRERRFWFGHCERLIDIVPFLEVSLFEPMDYAPAVLANGSSKVDPVKLNSGGKPKRLPKSSGKKTLTVSEAAALQGLPGDFLSDAPFTAVGKRTVIGNGVPLPLGRAVVKALQSALSMQLKAVI